MSAAISVLLALGRSRNCPSQILGANVLTIRNSHNDLVANTAVAQRVFPMLAARACYSGPKMNMLLSSTIGGLARMPREQRARGNPGRIFSNVYVLRRTNPRRLSKEHQVDIRPRNSRVTAHTLHSMKSTMTKGLLDVISLKLLLEEIDSHADDDQRNVHHVALDRVDLAKADASCNCAIEQTVDDCEERRIVRPGDIAKVKKCVIRLARVAVLHEARIQSNDQAVEDIVRQIKKPWRLSALIEMIAMGMAEGYIEDMIDNTTASSRAASFDASSSAITVPSIGEVISHAMNNRVHIAIAKSFRNALLGWKGETLRCRRKSRSHGKSV